jgi:mycofactocin precursor
MAHAERRGALMADETAVIVDNDEDATDVLVTEDVLVEEVSIDGMCGVY